MQASFWPLGGEGKPNQGSYSALFEGRSGKRSRGLMAPAPALPSSPGSLWDTLNRTVSWFPPGVGTVEDRESGHAQLSIPVTTLMVVTAQGHILHALWSSSLGTEDGLRGT